MKDKHVSEEELLDELDTMYQRVADIEKEEVVETPTLVRTKPKQRKKRSFRTIIIVIFIFFIVLASILAITIFDPMTLLQRLTMGDTQQPTVLPARPPRKPPSVVTPPAPPTPPAVATSPTPSPPASVAPSPAPPKPLSESFPVQAKQEAAKSTQEKVKKEKSIPHEITRPNKPLPQGKYFAIQVGSFRDMENVREMIQVFKKEELDAYWITLNSKKRGTLYRVFVGQFVDANEAAGFLKDKKIFKNYPDSFIREISSSKINR
jgi:cell division septation protein DedD